MMDVIRLGVFETAVTTACVAHPEGSGASTGTMVAISGRDDLLMVEETNMHKHLPVSISQTDLDKSIAIELAVCEGNEKGQCVQTGGIRTNIIKRTEQLSKIQNFVFGDFWTSNCEFQATLDQIFFVPVISKGLIIAHFKERLSALILPWKSS